jgi:2-desacetyl-2-hydroxyethyl bacteriochlorophyllide A dehydrogenase
MPRELLLTGARALEVRDYEEPPLAPGEFRAEAIASSISAGTELALYRGVSPFHERRFDLDLRVFVDDPAGGGYPQRLGYEWVGIVHAAGAEVTSPALGDRVHLPLPHRETHTVAVGTPATPPWLVLPAGLDAAEGTLLQSVTIVLQAVRDAAIKAGDHVAVFGLGTFGLLAVQLARLDGAGYVVAVDPIPDRRELAERYGADRVLDPTACDPGLEIKSANARRGVDVAIEFSGRYGALQQALRSVRVAGTVVAAGFYVGAAGSELRLGEEWLHNRLTMVASMQGWGVPPRDAGWDRQRLRAAALELVAVGRLQTAELLTQRVPFAAAAEAFALVDEHPEETLRVVLTY